MKWLTRGAAIAVALASVCAEGAVTVTASREYVDKKTTISPVTNGEEAVVGYAFGSNTNIVFISTNELTAVVTNLEERIENSQSPNYAAVSNAAMNAVQPDELALRLQSYPLTDQLMYGGIIPLKSSYALGIESPNRYIGPNEIQAAVEDYPTLATNYTDSAVIAATNNIKLTPVYSSWVITPPFQNAEISWDENLGDWWLSDGEFSWSQHGTYDDVKVEFNSNPAYTATRTRIGYTLGSQTNIILVATNSLDLSTNNTALVATIEATAPAPGNYYAVSNAAMNALSRAEAESGYTEWTCEPAEIDGMKVTVRRGTAPDFWPGQPYVFRVYLDDDGSQFSPIDDLGQTNLTFLSASVNITATRKIVRPTKVSQLTNDVGYVTETITNGLQTALPYPTNAIPYDVISGAPPLDKVVINSANGAMYQLGLAGGTVLGGYEASMAVGEDASADGFRAIAIGRESIAAGYGAIAIGNAVASNSYAVAIGTSGQRITSGMENVSYALATNDIAIGAKAHTSANSLNGIGDKIAIGREAKALRYQAIAMGLQAEGNSIRSVTIGTQAKTAKDNNVAIGWDARATNQSYSVAIGPRAASHGLSSIVVGTYYSGHGRDQVKPEIAATDVNKAVIHGSVLLGAGTVTASDTLQFHDTPLFQGNFSQGKRIELIAPIRSDRVAEAFTNMDATSIGYVKDAISYADLATTNEVNVKRDKLDLAVYETAYTDWELRVDDGNGGYNIDQQFRQPFFDTEAGCWKVGYEVGEGNVQTYVIKVEGNPVTDPSATLIENASIEYIAVPFYAIRSVREGASTPTGDMLATTSQVPVRVSQLANDSGYVTEAVTNGLQPELPYPTNAIPYTAISGFNKLIRGRYPLFIIDLNPGENRKWQHIELKATTNNFANAEGLTFFTATTSNGDSEGEIDSDILHDWCRLFIASKRADANNDVRRWIRIKNTGELNGYAPLTLAIIVDPASPEFMRRDVSKADEAAWLAESNTNLIWSFSRIADVAERDQDGNPCWRMIMPVKWYTELPGWADVPINAVDATSVTPNVAPWEAMELSYAKVDGLQALNRSVQYVTDSNVSGSSMTILMPTSGSIKDWVVYAFFDSAKEIVLPSGVTWWMANESYTNAIPANTPTALYFSQVTDGIFTLSRQELKAIGGAQ